MSTVFFRSQLIRFSGVALGEACTVVVRGATKQILDEAERSLHDALCVLTQTVKETKIVYGGGTWLHLLLSMCYNQLCFSMVCGTTEQEREWL